MGDQFNNVMYETDRHYSIIAGRLKHIARAAQTMGNTELGEELADIADAIKDNFTVLQQSYSDDISMNLTKTEAGVASILKTFADTLPAK